MAANVNREANLRGGCGVAAGRLRPPAKFSWYPASLVGILDGPFRGRELSLVPGQTSPASLTASTEARKFSWYPARLRRRPQPPRGLGNLQTTCLSLSDPSETFKQPVWAFPTPRKPSNNLFEPFRPLGNLKTTCLGLSDPSETFKQPVWAFPTPQKPSDNLFEPFRPLGAAAAAGEVFLVPGKLGRRP